jgi:hypothetical protein
MHAAITGGREEVCKAKEEGLLPYRNPEDLFNN